MKRTVYELNAASEKELLPKSQSMKQTHKRYHCQSS